MVKGMLYLVQKTWRKGILAKGKGHKEKAMGYFLNCYDLLIMLENSLTTTMSPIMIKKRLAKVKQEIRLLLADEEYLQMTLIPEEGIAEIKAAVEMNGKERKPKKIKEEIIARSVFVKVSPKKTLEVSQLKLVEYQQTHSPIHMVKTQLICEGVTKEFMYEKNQYPPIPLSFIAKEIRESTGINFTSFPGPLGQYVVQSTYPSIKDVLSFNLVEGGWLTLKEASQMEVIGYPAKKSNLSDALGLQTN